MAFNQNILTRCTLCQYPGSYDDKDMQSSIPELSATLFWHMIILNERRSRKKSESQMGFEPTGVSLVLWYSIPHLTLTRFS